MSAFPIVFWSVGIIAGVLAIIKTALDIAAIPTHRSVALTWLRIVRDLFPSFLVIGASFLPDSLIGLIWSLALIVAAGNIYCAQFCFGSPEPASRRDITLFVMFMCLCVFAAQAKFMSRYMFPGGIVTGKEAPTTKATGEVEVSPSRPAAPSASADEPAEALQ